MATTMKPTNSAYAELDVLSYEKIKNRDPGELERLAQAGRPDGGRGLFFLDLTGPSAGGTLEDAPYLYTAAARFFDRPPEEKSDYHKEGLEAGFNAHGDVEVYEIARDQEIAGTLELPPELQSNKAKLSRFLSSVDDVARDIYHALGNTLDPPDPLATIANMPSETGLQLAWARPEAHEGKVVAPAHTDRGLFTLLYYDAPTLEVPASGTDEWRLVKPVEGSVVGYVGKTLELTSQGRLSAPIHRVVAPRGGTYVAAYLLRSAFGTIGKAQEDHIR